MICILLVAGHDTVLETQIKVCFSKCVVAKAVTRTGVRSGSKFAVFRVAALCDAPHLIKLCLSIVLSIAKNAILPDNRRRDVWNPRSEVKHSANIPLTSKRGLSQHFIFKGRTTTFDRHPPPLEQEDTCERCKPIQGCYCNGLFEHCS